MLDKNFNRLQPGTALLPNTVYYVYVEALQPDIPNNLGVIYIENGDGYTSIPSGIDVSSSNNYRGAIYIKTVDLIDLPPQLYVKYRGATYDIDPNTNTPVYSKTIGFKTGLIP